MTDRAEVLSSAELAHRIRLRALDMTHASGSSHIGSILSLADILGVLYSGVLRVDPADPDWADRDRFILSKGHGGAAVYAALAETGFFDTAVLATHCQDGSVLSGHVSHKGVPGVEFSTGSLGHGVPVAVGMALAANRDARSHKVVVVCGDGECEEGTIWESALLGAHLRLDNLVCVIDNNKLQGLGTTDEVMSLGSLADKWRAFSWQVVEVDGHDHEQLAEAFANAGAEGRPTAVVAHTVKGKGVSFMEHSVLWHYRNPAGDDYEQARAEVLARRP